MTTPPKLEDPLDVLKARRELPEAVHTVARQVCMALNDQDFSEGDRDMAGSQLRRVLAMVKHYEELGFGKRLDSKVAAIGGWSLDPSAITGNRITYDDETIAQMKIAIAELQTNVAELQAKATLSLAEYDVLHVTQFTDTPGPGFQEDGAYSGQEFLETYLKPAFERALLANAQLRVDLDGTSGYSVSFLGRAFGGLAEIYGADLVRARLILKTEDEPTLRKDIEECIRRRNKDVTSSPSGESAHAVSVSPRYRCDVCHIKTAAHAETATTIPPRIVALYCVNCLPRGVRKEAL